MARITVAYYSRGGNLRQIAEQVSRGAEEHGAKVRLTRIPHWPDIGQDAIRDDERHPAATMDDLDWADGMAFGTPAMFGNVAAPVKHFIDSAVGLWQEGRLADKVVAGFTCAGSLHGGQESVLLALYQSIYHWGSLILPMGYTHPSLRAAGGNPYGVSAGAWREGDIKETTSEAARYLGTRLSTFAGRLVSAQDALDPA